jgi:hypothetical protein
MQRPAYLQNAPDLSDRAVSGLGTPLPPHVSIRGNKFTLVDGAGNKKLLGDTMDFLVADIGDHIGKMYFSNPDWTPDADDPPDCWSTNGVAPSRDAINPQARTCAECPQNVRGSRISKMSGASIKACRDEVLIAIVHPQFAGMLFQFKITPGSFKNWRKHVEECKNVSPGDHICTVLTRATFQDDVNGTVVFKAVSYPDQATWEARSKALAGKVTDALVGRLDRPREGLAAIVQERSPGMTDQQTAKLEHHLQNPTEPAHHTATNMVQPQDGFGQKAEPQKRHRRTKAEIEADNARAAQAQPAANQMAPFRPEAPPAPAGNGAAPFGIATQPPGPSADIQASLDQAFGAKPAGGGFGS